jgi:four helix bundle protein
MPKAGYKELIVYKKSKALTVRSISYFTAKKHAYAYNFLINQMLRSISSIGANFAEGYGTHYQKSFRHYLSIARGSSFETEYWLEVAIDLKIFDNKILNEMLETNVEIIKMLTGLMKNLERKSLP